jgi:hypothetical protein
MTAKDTAKAAAPAIRTVDKPVLAPEAATPALSDRALGKITGMAAAGSTEGAIARSLGLSPGRWRALKKANEGVADALAEGLAADLNTCLNALRRAALDSKGSMRKRGGLVPLLAYLKMRHGLRDHGAAPASDGGGGVNVTITLPGAMSHEQFSKLVDVTPAPAKEPQP